jgi:hypothetical protein
MTRLARLAELHFGSVPHGLEEPLLDDLNGAEPLIHVPDALDEIVPPAR